MNERKEYFYKVCIRIPNNSQNFQGIFADKDAESALNGVIALIKRQGYTENQIEFKAFNRV